MPFDFLRRRKGPAPGHAEAIVGGAPGTPDRGPSPGAHGGAGGPGIRFDGWTEDWRLGGTMHVEGRLSDALNRRESIAISAMEWGPVDGSAPMARAPGLKSVDPYDLIIVMGGTATMPGHTDEERAARRVRKHSYAIVLEAPPFRIRGTIHLFPGTEPSQILDQAAEMFVPLTSAVAYVGDVQLTAPGIEVILVNRLYVRDIETNGR